MKTPEDAPPNSVSPSIPDPIPDPVSDVHQASIEVVLIGLRETQPSSGLERRLLATLAAHAATSPHPTSRRSWLPSWLSPAPHHPLAQRRAIVWSALAASLLLTLLLAPFHHHRISVPITPVATSSPEAPSHLSIAVVPPVNRADPLCCPPERREHLSHLVVGHGAPQPAPASRPSPAAGYPAPPMPLTGQEELLLRAARSTDPQHSTVLNPNLRASDEAARTDEFQLFFVAATSIRNQEPPN